MSANRMMGAGVGSWLLVCLSVVGVRMLLAVPPPQHAPPPEAPPPLPEPSVRLPMKAQHCPAPDDAAETLADIEREARFVQLERFGIGSRLRLLGEPLPEDLLQSVDPDEVAASVAELVPEGAEVFWGCDQVPCSGVVLFDSRSEAQAFRAELDAEYPGAANKDPWAVADHGYTVSEGEPEEGIVVQFQVYPELEAEEHQARLYWPSRWNRKKAFEELRSYLIEP